MNHVFLLQHIHNLHDDREDVKLIGVFRTQTTAEAAIRRLSKCPGFSEAPNGFAIDQYRLDEPGWIEGYVTE